MTVLHFAWSISARQVGILDVDLCGPSIPRMLGADQQAVHQCDAGWVPVYTDTQKSLALMSIGFLLESPDEAVVWRGPKKTGENCHWHEINLCIVS